MRNTKNTRERLTQEWARYLLKAAGQGVLTGKPITLDHVACIPGPRAGALEIKAGLDTGKLLRALAKDDHAMLRQFVPWPFSGKPVAYMTDRYLRIEAGWPDSIAETIVRLRDLGKRPNTDGRWVVGKNERGVTVIAGLNDDTTHFLVSGATGSGKSVALRNAILQFSADPANRLVLADGKFGKSLRMVGRLRGVVGPVAVDIGQARAALGWACVEMRSRLEADNKPDGRLIVVIDEFQEWAGDPAFVNLCRKLAAQGRDASVHLLMATQHPTVGAFGDETTRRNLAGKLALRVDDPDASRVAVGGSSPRADRLLGRGDAYAVAPRAVHRVQGALVEDADWANLVADAWEMDDWGEFDAEAVGQELPTARPGARRKAPTATEIAVSLLSAVEGEGRGAFLERCNAMNVQRPGTDRARRILKLGRDVAQVLEDYGAGVVYTDRQSD